MNRLKEWKDTRVIEIEMSKEAQDEAAKGGNPTRTTEAYKYIFSAAQPNTNENHIYKKIEEILCPTGVKSKNEKHDVGIVFTAWKDKCILITNDGDSKKQPGGILGHARDLQQQLNIKIMRDSDAVSFVEDKIMKRDDRARYVSKKTGQSLPDWVGKD